MTPFTASRRQFLAALGATTLPSLAAPGFIHAARARPNGDNVLILIELAGGNDGLNSVVPIKDPAYRALRPEIGLTERELLSLDAETGLHPSMRGVADLWEDGALQVIEGVGYPNPSQSHFRSIEIWNTGAGAEAKTVDGWVAIAFRDPTAPRPADVDGLVLGGEMGPLSGAGRFSALRDVDVFLEHSDALQAGPHPTRPEVQTALAHVISVYESAGATREILRRRLERTRGRDWSFPESDLGAQLSVAARLLDAGVETPVIKVVHDGYDTHHTQPERHAALLTELNDAIMAFTAAMKQMGQWERVTLVTYSEFGRTARENASGGTDHGAAAPVFALGGSLKGGFGGARPSLDALVDGEMAHTTDYRALYEAILRDLWGIDDNAYAQAGFTGVSLLKT